MKYFYPILICIVLLLSNYNSYCQNDNSLLNNFNSEVIQPYIQSNNLFKEQVYIHFNKSCYLPGDDVWFSAYVTNPMTGLLNPYTQNLYVELYNEKGKLIGHKILAVNNGTASNMFKINVKELPGKYVFRAYTSWMKNFFTTEEFDRQLDVIGKSAEEKANPDVKYDVQFFPESGTLLAGIFNKVAIKALDPNGNSAILKGIIIDEKNDSVASFDLNKMGMGEVVLNPEKSSVYKAKVILPGGKEELYDLPAIEPQGVVASVNVFLSKGIIAEIKSNSESIGKGRLFYILVHANGNIYQIFTAKLAPAKTSLTIPLGHNSAGNGVNYLTVFDENFHPVCERLFYNYKKDIKGEIDIKPFSVKDTMQFRLSVLNDSIKHHFSSLSISILPEGTVSNRFTNSLLAEVLLKSGIRGKIENPQYYLEKQDPEHLIAMDLLMLTQGWRKYDWERIAAKRVGSNPNSGSELPDNFEKGFTIEGKVKNWLSGKENKYSKVSLFSPLNKIFAVVKVDSVGSFSFQNLSLLDSSRVTVSAVNSTGKGWNRTITASVNPNYKPDSIIKISPFISLPDIPEEKMEEPLKLMPGVIQLPEAVITAGRKKPFEKSLYATSFDKSIEITKDYLHYNDLETFFQFEFHIRLERTPDGNYHVNMGRSVSNTPPKLIIDEMEVQDWSILSSYTLNQIEAISVNKNGNGMMGEGGGIIIKTRTVPLYLGDSTPTNLKTLLIKGYSPPAQYYTPKYLQSPETETYQKYASIYWKPDIAIDSTGVTSLKFTVPQPINNLNVRIEGISDDGAIFLEEREINRGNQ